MGYDMHFVQRGHDDYFRLNIWGMGTYTQVMFDLGMVYISKSPGGWPEWNRYPDNQEKQGQFEAAHAHVKGGEDLAEDVPADVMATTREYVAQSDEILRHHADGSDVIPSHKFDTNDGWIVTPAEILAALAAYDARPDRDEHVLARLGGADRKAYWDTWIAYLRRAVDRDGFEVW